MKTNLFLIAISLFFVTACNEQKNHDQENFGFDKEAFDAERSQWFDMQLADYQFHASYFSDAGPEEAIITVKNGTVETIEPVPDKQHYGLSPFFISISDVYENIALDFAEHSEQINQGKVKGVAVKIKYNNEYHYPEEVIYSVGYNENMYGGYYYTLKISDFTVLI